MTLAVQQGRPPSELYRALHRIADRLEPEYRQAFLDAVERARDQIDMDALVAAVRQQNMGAVLDTLAVDNLSRALASGLEKPNQRLIRSAAETVAAETASELGVTFSFDQTDPNMVMAARTETARMVTNITQQTRQSIRAIVGDMFTSGLTVDEGARRIRDVVGLTERQGRAVGNLRGQLQELRRLGDDVEAADIERAVDRRLDAATKQRIRSAARRGQITDELIDEVSDTYRTSLNNYRARSIARTETIRAAHVGQEQSWQQANRRGVLDMDRANRVWIVTPDDRLCPICAPLAGAVRDEETGIFTSPFSGATAPHPPIHPMCRCSVGLMFGNRTL